MEYDYPLTVAFCLCYWFSVFFFSDCPLQILLCPAVAAQGGPSVATSKLQSTVQSDVDTSKQQSTVQSDVATSTQQSTVQSDVATSKQQSTAQSDVDTSKLQSTAQSDGKLAPGESVATSKLQSTAQSDGKLTPGESVPLATDTYFAAGHSACSGQSVLCSSENCASGHKDSNPSPDGDSTCSQTVMCAGGNCRLAAVHLDVTVSSVLQEWVDESVFSKPYLVKVPRHAPLTRRQYEESILYWPVTFHEDKRFIPPCCVCVGVQGFCCN